MAIRVRRNNTIWNIVTGGIVCGVFTLSPHLTTAHAQQQVISEKVAGQSAAAQSIRNHAEKSGMIEIDRTESLKNLPPEAASFARVPTNAKRQNKHPSKMAQAFAKIEKKLERGDEHIARKELTEFVINWPANTHARLLLSKLEIRHGNFQQARAILLPLKLNENSDWQPWFWSATARLNEGAFEHARSDLEQAAARDAEVVAIWIQQAVVEQQLDNHIGAIQLLQIARKLTPEKPQIHLNLAFSNEHLGNYSTALQNYQRFLQTSANTDVANYQSKVIRRIAELRTRM